jgi:hypothetical protein
MVVIQEGAISFSSVLAFIKGTTENIFMLVMYRIVLVEHIWAEGTQESHIWF